MSTSIATIMSVYKNDSHLYLEQAILSILNQSQKSDLFIYVDGEINDELYSILNKYSAEPSVFFEMSEVNRGLAFALNRLINLVLDSDKDYEFVARMDSDDISRVDRFDRQLSFFEHNEGVDVLGGACHEFGSSFALDIKILPTEHSELKIFSGSRCPFIHPTVMFRIDVFKQGFRYPQDTYFTEDMALWFCLLENGFIFANLPEVLLDYRLEETTLLRRLGLSKAKSEFKLRNSYIWKLGINSPTTVLSVYSRFIFHLLPEMFLKVIYKRMR